MAGVQKKTEGGLGARPRAREVEGEEHFPLSVLSRAPLSASQAPKMSLPFPFECPSTEEKEEYVFSRNIEILVNKPSHYFKNSIFVIFLAFKCSLLQCVISALFTNMRILKFKSQLTIAFFAAVNHLNGPLRKQNFTLTGSKGQGL